MGVIKFSLAVCCCSIILGVTTLGLLAYILFPDLFKLILGSIFGGSNNIKKNNVDDSALALTAERKCKEYEKLGCEHQLPPNGDNERSHPHMAYIIDASKNSGYACAGTLISDRFILTAVTCSKNFKSPVVKLGSSTGKKDGTGEWFEVSKDYQEPVYGIALMQLDKPVEFSPYIRPVCLKTKPEIETSDIFALGWRNEEKNQPIQPLRVIALRPTESDEESRCKKEMTKFQYTDPSSIHCSAYLLRQETTYPSTLGGPAQYQLLGECPLVYMQFGIATRDVFQDSRVEGIVPHRANLVLHVKLSSAISWIVKNVWPEG